VPQKSRRKLPFLVLAPAIVVVLGIATAVLVAWLGVSHLRTQSDHAAALRAELLGVTMAERVRATPLEERLGLIERATQRSGAELLLVRQDGNIVVDGTLGAPQALELVELLVHGAGEVRTQTGRARYSVAPLGEPLAHLSVIAFVRAPDAPHGTASLLTSVAALAAILVGAAALAAYSVARNVHNDVTYVRGRIVEMAREEGDSVGTAIPVRSADQVGVLTNAFNVLVDRFAAAEHAYRQDLAGALAYDRDRSAFLAALSHELRTPLNAILGFTEVLLAEVDGPLSTEAREDLMVVRTSGEHLRSLIGDILDLSALESGELQLSRHHVDVFGVAVEVVREARLTAQEKPLEVNLDGGSATAWADPRRIRQILGNVIGNAIKFTTEGYVNVHVQGRGRFVAVSVSDSGPGIAPEEQAAIFEEYRQAGDVSARRVGTGLGLAITRRLVQMHGGFIEVQSDLGRGSRFTIVLPSEPPQTTQTTDVPKRTPLPVPSQRAAREGTA
jgi:signal transduction histidine kinase